MARTLTPAQVAAFERDGFLSSIDILSADEAHVCRKQLEAAEARWPDDSLGANRNNAHLVLPFLDRLTHHPAILDVVEDLIGPDLLVNGSVLFIKEARSEGFICWHQDGTYMGLEPDDGVTAWIALTPSNRSNGCMSIIPGTHKSGIHDHHDQFDANNLLTRGQAIDDVAADRAVDLVFEPSQASFHHSRTIHGSQPNQSDTRRIDFAVQSYIRADVRQTKAEGFAQHARGQTDSSAMSLLLQPSGDLKPEDTARREHINRVWSDVLYAGAERRRNH